MKKEDKCYKTCHKYVVDEKKLGKLGSSITRLIGKDKYYVNIEAIKCEVCGQRHGQEIAFENVDLAYIYGKLVKIEHKLLEEK